MKYNSKVSTKTTNLAGGSAYKTTSEMELYMLACASLMEDSYYESAAKRLQRLKELVKACDPEFVSSLTMYVREKMYLRSVSHALCVELANYHKGYAASVIERVCQRPDDMTEILAYQLENYKKPIPNQIKKGLARAFAKFDEYQLAKYNKDGAVKLKDVLFLSHAKGNELTKKLIDGVLETPYTWETELSEKGNSEKVWKELIKSGKLGYMALLRNLRNILNVIQDEKGIKAVAKLIADKKAVQDSKQLPFRFWSAFRELKNNANPFTSHVLKALDTACGYSAKNLKLSGTSLIVCDVSGSMQENVSAKSSVKRIEVGLVMGGIAKMISPNSIMSIFGDTFKVKNTLGTSVFESVLSYKEGEVGYSTHGHLALEWLNAIGTKVDNILFFTDCQLYEGDLQSELSKYKSNINPKVKAFMFDLSGYGELQIVGPNCYNISGWSDKVFEYIESIENAQNVLNVIKNYK
jgi:hypothetical protein